MIKRGILFLTVALSLTWIAYYAFDILNSSNNYEAEKLFGVEDEELLIIIRPSEIQVEAIPDFSLSPASLLMSTLNDSLYQTGYVSKTRNHLLLTSNSIWNETLIKQLFNNAENVSFDGEKFTFDEYQGRFHKKDLYLSKGEIETIQTENEFIYDSKASAAIIQFDSKEGIASHSDIYVKENGLINYVTKNTEIQVGNKVSDEDLFSGVISRNIDSYHFTERTYGGQKDSILINSPMYRWMQYGFVEVSQGANKAIITDYIEGQDPILVLNDLTGSYDTNRFSVPLLKGFPENGSSYSIEYMEEFVVISNNKNYCKKLISDYKLGNTIALNENAINRYYGSLPKNVSERMVSKELTYSRSAYKGKLLESYTNSSLKKAETSKKETISISIGDDIQDFYAFAGDGNLITLSKNGDVKRFVNQNLKWTKSIGSSATGEIQIIDLHASGEKQILISTKEEIHLLTLAGDNLTGFPYEVEEEASSKVKFYRWKGQSYFLIGQENGKILHLDAKGRELNQYQTAITATEDIQVWASQKRLFAGFSNGASFVMYDMENKRTHREFLLPYNSKALKIPNELLHFGIDQKEVLKIDQKGNQIKLGDYRSPKILDIYAEESPIIIIQATNEIHLLNVEGIPFGEIRLPFNEVDDIFIENTDSGKTLVGVIDGLENNVYLYQTDGELVTKKGLEGQSKLFVHSSNQGYRITTIVDQFVIQYFEN